MDDNGKLALKIMREWRNQNNMISAALTSITEELPADSDVCEILNALSSALDDCSDNLAGSIVASMKAGE